MAANSHKPGPQNSWSFRELRFPLPLDYPFTALIPLTINNLQPNAWSAMLSYKQYRDRLEAAEAATNCVAAIFISALASLYMSSLKRILASRANGRLSKGPTTAAGKQRSSANAITHGLLVNRLVLDGESATGFHNMLRMHLERLQPADALEVSLVEDLVAALWRIQRTRAVEARMIGDACPAAGPDCDPLGRLTSAFTTLNQSGALPLIHRYETRLHAMYQRALQNLLVLRTLFPGPESPAAPPGGTKQT